MIVAAASDVVNKHCCRAVVVVVAIVVSCIMSFAGNSFRNPISISNKRLCEKSFVRYVRVASPMSSVGCRVAAATVSANCSAALLDDDLPLMHDCRVPTHTHTHTHSHSLTQCITTQVSMLQTHMPVLCMYVLVCVYVLQWGSDLSVMVSRTLMEV